MSKFEHVGLDAVDFQILRELSVDGRASDVWLGEKINLSSTAVARRRKRRALGEGPLWRRRPAGTRCRLYTTRQKTKDVRPARTASNHGQEEAVGFQHCG